MEKKDLKKWTILIVIAAISLWVVNNLGIVLSFINKMFIVFLPFILGCVFAFILNILMVKIERKILAITKGENKKGVVRVISVILSFVLFALVVGLILFLLLPELIANVQSLVQSIPGLFTDFQNFVLNLLKKYPDLQGQINELFAKDNLTVITTGILNYVANGLIGLIGSIISGFITLFTAIVFSIYILCQKEYLQNCGKKLLEAYVPKKRADKIKEVIKLSSDTFTKFISGQCLEAIILGLILFGTLILFKFPYALLISVLTAITALIPIFGAVIAMVVGAILIAIENPLQALMFMVVFQVVQQFEGNFIYPRVVGKSVGLSPMWTLLAITVGGSLFGVMGMLVGLPLASIIYALIRSDVYKRISLNSKRKLKQKE